MTKVSVIANTTQASSRYHWCIATLPPWRPSSRSNLKTAPSSGALSWTFDQKVFQDKIALAGVEGAAATKARYFTLGSLAREMIKRGVARYNWQTGKWEWGEPPKESKTWGEAR
jgi:hypothetical protein